MPTGDPPDPWMPSTVFTALAAMNYDSAAMAFKDTNNALQYLFVERKPNTVSDTQWSYATDAAGGSFPRGQVPQITFDVIKYGTLNPQTGLIAYQAKNYRIRLCRDLAAGKQLAKAVVV